MKNKMEMTLKLVTPKDAKQMLDGHVNYRKAQSRRINAYANLMEKGKWFYSILLFDEDDTLIDGQNRLNAIIKSNTSQYFVIITGWPRSMIVGIDNAQARTGAQTLKAERPEAMDHNKVIAACTGIEKISSGVRGAVVLNAEKLELYDKYGDLAMSVISRLPKSMKAGVHAIAFCKAILKYPDRESDVFEALDKMKDLDFSEPRMSGLKLYFNWAVVRGFAKGGGDTRKNAYLRQARAIKAYLDNQSIDKLYCPTKDPFDLKNK